jgi:hypothetical protein
MTGRTRRGKSRGTVHPSDDATDGTARYMWAFVQNKAVVLSIPGLRDLELSADDARTIGRNAHRTGG